MVYWLIGLLVISLDIGIFLPTPNLKFITVEIDQYIHHE